ncbi:MAG: zf-HC2 domain-containing protein [Akkermansiaceae bacterium]|nr:zf-HC2 domain-containing protein [Armatimonadota bacterium]
MLSAYIDRELTGMEMLEVRAHVEQCEGCRAEQESLSQTKKLLSSLSYTTPRAELEQLLVVRAERVANPSLLDRIMPPEWSDAMLWRWEGIGNLGSPRLRPLAATAFLSLAGLCLATAGVNQPGDESPFGDSPNAQTFAVYVGPTGALTRVPTMPDMGDIASRRTAGVMPVSLMQGGGIWQTMATPSLPAVTRVGTGMPAGWENDLILPSTTESAVVPTSVAPRPQFNRSVLILSTRDKN